MRRFLLLMLTAVTLLASCQKDADLEVTGAADDGMVDVTVSASMECASATTRAIASYGDGATIDRCIMEVYIGSDLYKRMVTSNFTAGDSNTREVTFELRLVAGQTYDFLFWADKDASTADADADAETEWENYADATTVVGEGDKHYTTINGLKAITTSYNNYTGSDETRDAFFGSILNKDITASVELPVTLTRPFGQLNISTYLTDVLEPMYPKAVKINYSTTVGDTFNVSDGVVSGSEKAIDWNVTKSIETSDVAVSGSTLMHLSTDYLFASENEQDIHNFSMTFYSDVNGGDAYIITTNDNFKNIPIQRNYRTNVSGELLTKQGTVTVTIDPDFDTPDYKEEVYEVSSVYEIANIIAKATTESVYIKVVQDLTTTDNSSNTCYVYFADNEEVEDITLEFTDVSENTNIYIGGDASNSTSSTTSTTYNGTLNVITGKDADNNYIEINSLSIYAESAHVEYTGYATSETVITSKDTFVLVEDSKIGTLTVEGGNVEVYGTVGDETGDNKGIIISATNKTTKSIEVYDGATVYEATPADSYSSDESIAITIYDGGEVIIPIENPIFTIAAAVSEGATAESAESTFSSFLESTVVSTIILTEDITLSDEEYTTNIDKTIITSGQIILDGTATLTNVNVNYTGTETFIVPEGATIKTLTVTGGNVEIHGVVNTSIVRGESNQDTATIVKIYTETGYIADDATVDDDITILYVNPSLPIQNLTSGAGYDTLTEAVTAASAGDTIYVSAGEYTTAIKIDKALTIQGPNAGVAGYSDERVAEANFTTNAITFAADDITIDGLSFNGGDNSYPVTLSGDIENLTFKNLYVNDQPYTFLRNTDTSGDVTNLVVESCKFSEFDHVTFSFTFLLYNLISATFIDNVFDDITRHGLNLQVSPDAVSLVIKDNTFTDCGECAIQLANQNAGKIDIYNNTIKDCYTAFNIYAWKSVGPFAAQIDVYENTVSDVQTFASVGNADYVNSAGVPLPFEDGAYITFEDNTISLNYWQNTSYAHMLSDFYSYDGVVTFTNNDVSGGRTGVYNTWANILNTYYAFYTYGHSCTQVNIDGVLYQPASTVLLERVE